MRPIPIRKAKTTPIVTLRILIPICEKLFQNSSKNRNFNGGVLKRQLTKDIGRYEAGCERMRILALESTRNHRWH